MKRFFTKLIFAALACVLFQGCVTQSMKRKLEFDPASSENGLIVGSITFPSIKPKFDGYYPHIKGVDNKKSFEFEIAPEIERKIEHNGELNNGKTYLFAVEAKPGKYEMDKIRVTSTGYMNSTKTNVARDFIIPIDVKKGEIVYIGEIFFNEYATDDKLLLFVEDNFERDIKGLKLKQPSIDWTKAKKGTVRLMPKK